MGAEVVPRVIWLLWFQGWDVAPELAQICLRSWRDFNPSWVVRAISRDDLPELLGELLPGYERTRLVFMREAIRFGAFEVPPAMEADLLRLILLAEYGGVWADSSMLCRRPLDDWLPKVASSGFFAFSPEDNNDSTFVPPVGEESPSKLAVTNSFLASEPGHLITTTWLEAMRKHWADPGSSPEALGDFHYAHLFGRTIVEAPRSSPIANAWAGVPRVSGEYGVQGSPHFFVPYHQRLWPPCSPELQAAILEDFQAPMVKLTHHGIVLRKADPASCLILLLEDNQRRAGALWSNGHAGAKGVNGMNLAHALHAGAAARVAAWQSRVLWVLWFQGWENAPSIVHLCLESWRLYNPSWAVRAIDRADLASLLGEAWPVLAPLASALRVHGGSYEADLLRLALLSRHGGVWVDATMLCRRPLDEWLSYAAAEGFFAFSPETGDDPVPLPVMNSFVASSSGHTVLRAWLKSAQKHLDQRIDAEGSINELDYFWAHKSFDDVVSGAMGEEAADLWARTPRLTGEYGVDGPHFWVPYPGRLWQEPCPNELREVIAGDHTTPMWKLTIHGLQLADASDVSCFRLLVRWTLQDARRFAAAAS